VRPGGHLPYRDLELLIPAAAESSLTDMESGEGRGMMSFVSIGDCAICAVLPQKLIESATDGGEPVLPAQVEQLRCALQLGDARLLQCPACATYYYYSRDHEDRDICAREKTDVTLRRYGPVRVREFLESAGSGAEPPMTMGQFRQALLDSSEALAPSEAAPGERLVEQVRSELQGLAGRYEACITDLTRLLAREPRPSWHIMAHAVESLGCHYLARSDWLGMSALLLAHGDPAVRLVCAEFVSDTGLHNLSTFDLLHTPSTVRAYLDAELKRRERVEELARVLEAVVLGPPFDSFTYSWLGYERVDGREQARNKLAFLLRDRSSSA
jgi:hypothetical protein